MKPSCAVSSYSNQPELIARQVEAVFVIPCRNCWAAPKCSSCSMPLARSHPRLIEDVTPHVICR